VRRFNSSGERDTERGKKLRPTCPPVGAATPV